MKHGPELNKVAGVSLIEVLVTALILGVGLLGVAAMQVTSINSNQEAYFRSQATDISENLAARIRAAKMVIYDGVTPLANVIDSYNAGGGTYACDAVASCVGGNCTPAQLVAFDRSEICNLAADELPEGEVYVAPGGGIRLRIAVAWTPTAARADLGQNQILNADCANIGVPNNKDCVILEVIP